jgi:alkyl sulfatase BDS1-like metallo-beta-lactamase superfamily hydrolase
MTIIEGDEGITIVDPLVSAETAKVGLDLYYEHREQKPVKAVIYTHSHVDHYGGVRGVVDEAAVESGDAKIYAPEGFLEAAVAENVMAGNAMSRRASYMYGNLLPPDAKGQVGAGLGTWGDKAEALFAQHHWPTWGNENVVELLQKQRDLYRYINDETLRLANQGYKMREIAEQIELPESLAIFWANRGYYGSLYHDVAATYVLYLGWFDGNPATLHELPPVEASKHYVEFMGGADAVLAKAKESYAKGDYRWVAQVVNHVVFADPDNHAAKDLQADALEQLGYQAESGPWRNFYLSGAKELREGVAKLPTPNTASPDTVRAMSPEMFFDYLGVRLNAPKAAAAKAVLNFDFGDTGGKYLIELENGVLNHTADRQADDADATVTLTRDTLNSIILQETKLADAISAGDVKVSGDQAKLEEVVSYLDSFEFWFNIVTPNATN